MSTASLTNGHPSSKFRRVDTIALKNELFDLLDTDHATLYWISLGEFFRGKIRREEFAESMKGVLDTGAKLRLHNHLLTAILHNAISTQPIAVTPTISKHPTAPPPPILLAPPNEPLVIPVPSPSITPLALKRPHQDLNISDLPDVLPKRSRIRDWLGGLNRAERDRLKRLGSAPGGSGEERGKMTGEMQRGFQGRGRMRQATKPLRPNVLSTLHPLAQSTGYIPSQGQIKDRIEALARINGMTEGVGEGMDELLGVALDTHLDGLFRAAVEFKLKAQDEDHNNQPKSNPSPHPSSPLFAGLNILKQDPTYTPAPPDPIHLSLQDFHSLFTLSPGSYPQVGSAVWGLRNGVAEREEQVEEEAKILEKKWKAGPSVVKSATISSQPVVAIEQVQPNPLARISLPPGPGGIIPRPSRALATTAVFESGQPHGRETMRLQLEAMGLYKVTDGRGVLPGASGVGGEAGRNTAGEGAAVHGPHHWLYVDPAIILRDVLG